MNSVPGDAGRNNDKIPFSIVKFDHKANRSILFPQVGVKLQKAFADSSSGKTGEIARKDASDIMVVLKPGERRHIPLTAEAVGYIKINNKLKSVAAHF